VVASMDDKPSPVSCPHCGANAERLPVMAGDRCDIRCPTCGIYSISRTKAYRFDKGRADPKAAGFVTVVSGRRCSSGSWDDGAPISGRLRPRIATDNCASRVPNGGAATAGELYEGQDN
jgi:endogenous inhibitor of DNA gyrase (YacG/DUF329 family)